MTDSKFNIPLYTKGKLEMLVTIDDTAKAYGSGLVEVFATPAMIALMERTALESIDQLLPDGYGTVGVAVNINHIKASPVGEKISSYSRLTRIETKKLTFEVEARDERGLIGMGEHTRYIVKLDEFLNDL